MAGINMKKSIKLQKTKKITIEQIFIFGLLGLLIALYTIFNFTSSEYIIDYDASLAMRHAIEIWKNHTILLPDFINMSTLELDAATFLAAPLFLITNNLSFSLALVHFILLIIFVYSLMALGRNLSGNLTTAAIGTILVLLPWSVGWLGYTRMMFISGGQYELRAMLIILLMAILSEKNRKGKMYYLTIVFYLLLTFLTSLSSGVYIFMVAFIPLSIYEAIKVIQAQSFRQRAHELAILILGILVSGIGISIWLKADMAVTVNKSLTTAQDFFNNLWNSICGIFLLTGGMTTEENVALFSTKGLVIIICFILTAICILTPIIIAIRFHEYRVKEPIQQAFILAGINLISLVLINSHYGMPVFEARYHIPWFIPWLLVSGCSIGWLLKNQNKNIWFNRFIISAFLISCFIIVLNSTVKLYQTVRQSEYDTAQELIYESKKLNMNTIFFLSSDLTVSTLMRVIDTDMEIYGLIRTDTDSGHTYNAQLIDNYTNRLTKKLLGNSSILVTTEDEFVMLPPEISDAYTYIGSIEQYKLYHTQNNPWPFIKD